MVPVTPLAEGECRFLARQLVSAVSHIHAQRCVHLDIKPANLLMIDGRLVLADFGSAMWLQLGSDGRVLPIFSEKLTPAFAAPECKPRVDDAGNLQKFDG